MVSGLVTDIKKQNPKQFDSQIFHTSLNSLASPVQEVISPAFVGRKLRSSSTTKNRRRGRTLHPPFRPVLLTQPADHCQLSWHPEIFTSAMPFPFCVFCSVGFRLLGKRSPSQPKAIHRKLVDYMIEFLTSHKYTQYTFIINIHLYM